MGKDTEKIVLNGATSQYDRWLPALRDSYANVDDRSFSELLEFSVEFGRLINFYNLANEVDGDWVDFFAADLTIILACIEMTDIAGAETAFLDIERRTLEARHFERKFDLFRQMFAAVMRLARQLNQWLVGLGSEPRSETADLLRGQIAAAIGNLLGPQLRLLVSYAEGAGLPDALGQPIRLDLHGFLPIWQLHQACPDGSIYRGHSRNRKIDHACPSVNGIFTQFLDSLSHLKIFAQNNLAVSLDDADHTPQTALYVAFARLFKTAQDTINTTSSRYIHFYYHDILREDFRPAVPDSAYLTFTLATDKGVASTTVPRDTLFVAGRDSNGLDILFAADKSLLVTGAEIVRLRTLRVIYGPLFTPAAIDPAGSAGDAIQRVLGTEIAAGKGAWSTFGETQPGATDIEVTTPATMGFALASPYLLLTGGTRLVTVGLTYSRESAARLAPLLDQLAAATGLSAEAVLHDVLLQAFTLYVSTATGWQAIETSYDVVLTDTTEGDPGFELSFTLSALAPPVVAFDPASAPPGGPPDSSANPDSTRPTLKVYLNQGQVTLGAEPSQVQVYPLSLLAELDLTAWEIKVDVTNLAALQISNTTGPVDPGKPFLVLGAPVVLGSFLEIRHQELFAKTLDRLEITIKWFNLPQNDDGFKGWYRDYVLGPNGTPQGNLFNNQVFRVGICVVNPGSWQLTDPASDTGEAASCATGLLYLFRSKSPTGVIPDCQDTLPAQPLCPSTDFNKLKVTFKTPPAYYNAVDSAVRIQLTAPSYAFGDDLYAQNVLKAVIDDLPDADTTMDSPPVPAKCEQWKDLWDASQLIVNCLAGCAEQPPDAFKTCITPRLVSCKQSLLEMTTTCILDCLTAAQGMLEAEQYGRLRKTFGNLGLPSDPDLSSDIMRWIEYSKTQVDPAAAPAFCECLKNCLMIVEAVICIEECELKYQNEQPDAYKRLMTSCLDVCAATLAKPYVDCCQAFTYPNTPWMPQAENVSVDYSARWTGTLDAASAAGGRFYYLTPFDGYCVPPPRATTPLLPSFPYSGNLYIGLAGLAPPQSLTLLFQMTAAGAGGWSEKPPPVTWQYLDGNDWTSFEPSQLVADGTNGLQNSGVLALNLPAYAASANTVMGADCQWLSAGVASDPSLFPKTYAIYPNALLATWQDNGSVEHLSEPLPAHTIKSSVQDLPDIATIDQPMESFGGRPPETGRSFQTWMGERLRHKDRGILGWDYERMVLEQFPAVWKVQALPARNARQGAVPGDVLVVVVPGPNSIDVMDPTMPMASADTLAQIGASLGTTISPFIQLNVSNPVYVRITVTAVVQFSDSEDPGACIRRLNDSLVKYLSPWFYDAARAVKGGDYASEDEIVEFVLTQPYVDALVSIGFDYDPETKNIDWYFLTSAEQHCIDAAGTEAETAQTSRQQSSGSRLPPDTRSKIGRHE